MEMQQQGFPVDPMQIIEKMELPESEKTRWMNYITQSNKAQQEQQQAMLAKELEFKEREMADDERETTLKFIVDMAKIKQMGEKDEKKMMTDFTKMSFDEKAEIMKFVAQMASVAQQAAAAEQEMKQDESKHVQDMKFDKEKHAQTMKQTKEKAAIAAANAKKAGRANGTSTNRKSRPKK